MKITTWAVLRRYLAIGLAVALAACGNKGPLILPSASKPTPPAPTKSTAPANAPQDQHNSTTTAPAS